MLIKENTHGYSKNKKIVTGRGFVDSVSGIFRNIGSYISTNKDLIAKPLLGAVGSLGATALTAGVPALLKHIVNKHKKLTSVTKDNQTNQISLDSLDSKSKEIVKNIMTSYQQDQNPVSNIIGSGIKRF